MRRNIFCLTLLILSFLFISCSGDVKHTTTSSSDLNSTLGGKIISNLSTSLKSVSRQSGRSVSSKSTRSVALSYSEIDELIDYIYNKLISNDLLSSNNLRTVMAAINGWALEYLENFDQLSDDQIADIVESIVYSLISSVGALTSYLPESESVQNVLGDIASITVTSVIKIGVSEDKYSTIIQRSVTLMAKEAPNSGIAESQISVTLAQITEKAVEGIGNVLAVNSSVSITTYIEVVSLGVSTGTAQMELEGVDDSDLPEFSKVMMTSLGSGLEKLSDEHFQNTSRGQVESASASKVIAGSSQALSEASSDLVVLLFEKVIEGGMEDCVANYDVEAKALMEKLLPESSRFANGNTTTLSQEMSEMVIDMVAEKDSSALDEVSGALVDGYLEAIADMDTEDVDDSSSDAVNAIATVIMTAITLESSENNFDAQTVSTSVSEKIIEVVVVNDSSQSDSIISTLNTASGGVVSSTELTSMVDQVNSQLDTTAPTLTMVDISSIEITSNNVSSYSVSGTCSENDRNVSISASGSSSSTPLSGTATCSSSAWSKSLDLSTLSDGTITITANHDDAAGNSATQVSDTVTKDTTASTATIAEEPEGTNNTTTLDVTVAGTDVTYYKYKVGLSAETDCSSSTGYSDATLVASKISDDISALSDGEMKLCVIGKDSAGNWQTIANATSATWTKDATATTATISEEPENTNNTTTLDVTVAGTDVTYYKYKVGLSVETDCSSSTGYSDATLVASKISNDISGLFDGAIKLCVIGKDSAGNWQTASNATSATWTKDATAPTTFSITGPDSYTSDDTPQITWENSTAGSTYDINVDDSGSTCPSPEISVTGQEDTSYTITSALDDGTYYVCVTANDSATNSTDATNNGYTFVVDTQAPDAPSGWSFTYLVNGCISNDTAPAVTGSDLASENGSTVQLLIGAASCDTVVGTDTISDGSFSLTGDLTGQGDGSIKFWGRIVDQASNASDCAELSVTITLETDSFTTTTGSDTFCGGPNADTLTGGYGGDILIGGLGADTFYPDNQSFNKSTVSGLTMWLDGSDPNGDGSSVANGTLIETWTDKSDGSNDVYDLTPATDTDRPTYTINLQNGRPGLDFDGGDWLSDNGSMSTYDNLTIFALASTDKTGSYPHIFTQEDDNSDGDGLVLFYKSGDSSYEGTLGIHKGDWSSNFVYTGTSPTVDQIYLTGGIVNGGTTSIVLNGTLVDDVDGNTNAATYDPPVTVQIGTKISSSMFLNGQILEILFYNSALSSSNYDKVEQYLSLKYGIELGGLSFGIDTMTGGAGADTYIWNHASYSGASNGTRDIITDFEHLVDKIDLSDFGTVEYYNYQSGGNTIVGVDINNDDSFDLEIQLTGSVTITDDDFIGTVSEMEVTVLDETLLGGADTHNGSIGNDTYSGTSSTYSTADNLDGSNADDTLVLTGGGTFTLQSNITSIETIDLDDNTYNLTISDMSGDTTVDGSAITSSYTLTVTTDSGYSDDLTVNGGAGHDSISGGIGDDTLSGNNGNDTITGGAGVDSLIGGSGDDTFYPDNQAFSKDTVSGLTMWIDGSDPNGDGSSETNGTLIETWADKSDGDNDVYDLTPATDTDRPTYTINLQNGRPGMDFDGGDWLSDNGSMTTSDNVTILALASTNNTGTYPHIFTWDDNGNGIVFFFASGYTTPYSGGLGADRGDWSSNFVYTGVTPTADQIYLMGGITNADGTSSIMLNGSQVDDDGNAAAITYGASPTVQIGTKIANNMFLDGQILEILVYNSALSSTNYDKVEQYLSVKYGMALAGTTFGVNTLSGGLGDDTFNFNNVYPKTGSGSRDVITDFKQSSGSYSAAELDLIEFSNRGLSYIGNAAFSAVNQLRWYIDTGNDRTIVQIDFGGDGTADMEIELTGEITLDSTDFVLE